ncbi:MAG: hypothetical protein Q9169_006725, partial [Polycauliona sp. 2 TL-2023]
MHFPTLLLPLLSLPLTLATTLTLTLPSTLPPLSPSSRAHLTTHNLQFTTPLTKARTFRFTNLTSPGTYNLDIYSRDYAFEGAVVVIFRAGSRDGGGGGEKAEGGYEVEVFRRNAQTGGKGVRMVEKGVDRRVELRVRGVKAYYEERQG